jgi:hypothetical protein
MGRSSLSSLSLLALSLVVVACGGATVDPPGAGSADGTASTSTASTSPPSTTDSAPTPNVCNAPFNAAPVVLEMEVPIEPPESAGGAVTDGTYHLVDVAFDTGTSGQAGRWT